jgi:hypothetical protein
MIPRWLKLIPFLFAPLVAGPAIAAASDESPTPAQEMANPSKTEPMMIEPSTSERAEAYRRDLASCDEHSAEGRQVCRDMVNEQYGTRTDEPQQQSTCDRLEGAEKAECLSGASAGDGRMRPVVTRSEKTKPGMGPASSREKMRA